MRTVRYTDFKELIFDNQITRAALIKKVKIIKLIYHFSCLLCDLLLAIILLKFKEVNNFFKFRKWFNTFKTKTYKILIIFMFYIR